MYRVVAPAIGDGGTSSRTWAQARIRQMTNRWEAILTRHYGTDFRHTILAKTSPIAASGIFRYPHCQIGVNLSLGIRQLTNGNVSHSSIDES